MLTGPQVVAKIKDTMKEKHIKKVRLAEAIGVNKDTTTQNKILSLKSAFNRIENACVLDAGF